MTDYKIIYQTHNDHENPVSEAFLSFLLRPAMMKHNSLKVKKSLIRWMKVFFI